MIREPVILVGGGGADVFRTKEDAERFTEPIDIEDGEYVAYDAGGRLLDLTISADGRRGQLTLSDPPKDRSEELVATLRSMLGHIAELRPVQFDKSRLHEYPLERLVEITSGYCSPI